MLKKYTTKFIYKENINLDINKILYKEMFKKNTTKFIYKENINLDIKKFLKSVQPNLYIKKI